MRREALIRCINVKLNVLLIPKSSTQEPVYMSVYKNSSTCQSVYFIFCHSTLSSHFIRYTENVMLPLEQPSHNIYVLSEMYKFKYIFLTEVEDKGGVVLDCIILPIKICEQDGILEIPLNIMLCTICPAF